jgi:NAD(P)-dependent dehydrogenase (short-subunit alcohol dehydrogenase family)
MPAFTPEQLVPAVKL